jgi:hypothetical protein
MLYNPFQRFDFNPQTCFLTGQVLQDPNQKITVFAEALMDAHDLREKPFKLLDESIKTYGQLIVPCADDVAAKLNQLDKEVVQALEAGVDAVRALDQWKLFQWIGKTVYGLIYNEITLGIAQQHRTGEALNFSQVLAHKFKNLHHMLQSILKPLDYEGGKPYSIQIFEVDHQGPVFQYRDEINTLVFSMRVGEVGVIACLQDNGMNERYHQEILEKVNSQCLHPVQFEELCGRFFYSAYLFNRLPEYLVMDTPEQIFVEPMDLDMNETKPMFDHWQAKTYGQVLENFWKPWGFTLFEIIKDPERPMSFLLNEEDQIIRREEIALDLA